MARRWLSIGAVGAMACGCFGAETLLDFAKTGDLTVKPRMETSGSEGTTRYSDRFASSGTKCFYFGMPVGTKLLYPWAVTVIGWSKPMDFSPYDRAVLDYVNAAVEGDSLTVRFGPQKGGTQGVTERLANCDAGRIVVPLRFQDPAAAHSVTQLCLTVVNPGQFNVYLDRILLLKKGEALPPARVLTESDRRTLAEIQRESDALAAKENVRRLAAEKTRQRDFRDRFKAVAPGGEMMVGLATSMDQVKPCATELEPNAATAVAMRLARGESEAVQVYVMPRGELALKDVSVAFEGDLVRDRPWWAFWRSQDRLDAACLKTCVVGHLDCRGSVIYKRAFVEGSGTNFVRRAEEVYTPGWYPDPLLSFKKSCDVDPLVCQAFYVQVKAPESAVPGVYRGILRVTARNAAPVEIPVSVRVNSFALPREAALPLAVTFGPMVWTKRQWVTQAEYDFLTGLRKSPAAPVNAWKRHEDEWADFLAERYVMPSSLYHHQSPLPFAGKLAQYRQENRLGWYCLGYFGPLDSLDAKDEESWRKRTLPRLRANYRQAKELGIQDRAYIYGCDEAHNDKFPRIARAVAILKEEFPDVPVSTTAVDPDLGMNGSLLGQMDWFIPLTSRPHYTGNEARIAQARKAGKKVWWYVACGEKGPRANVFVETRPAELRSLLSAQSWKSKTDGFLYFETSIWNAGHPIAADTTPFTDWPAESWRRGASFHGDGTMVYCGPDCTPLSSLHFEALRDGVEDYAYLKLLAEKLAANQNAPWADEAKRLLACEQVRSVYDFDDTPERHYAWRNAIADLIERD